MPTPNDAPSVADESRRRLTRRLFFGLPLLAGVLAARPQAAHAGTSTSTWKMEGNSDVDDNDFIGSKNDKSLIFKTKNVERLRITNAGRIGIGTTNPGNTLHVVAPNGGITAIRGDTSSTDNRATGVLGQAVAGAASTTPTGVKGVVLPSADNRGGYGVWGDNQIINGVGVYGSGGTNGIGVRGYSNSEFGGTGVFSLGTTGVHGKSGYYGPGVLGESSGYMSDGVEGVAIGEYVTAVRARMSKHDVDLDGTTEPTSAAIWASAKGGQGIVATTDSTKSTAVRGHASGDDTSGVLGSGRTAGVVGAAYLVGVVGYGGGVDSAPTEYDQLWGLENMQYPAQGLGVPLEGIGVHGVGTTIGVVGSPYLSEGIGVLGVSTGVGYAGYFKGRVQVEGALQVGTGSVVQHVVISPQALASLSGNVTLDGSGQAIVTLPADSPLLTDVRYQLTAIGGAAPGLHIAQELAGGVFSIAGGTAGLKVSWRIEGTR